jgi:hypothetical protein
MIFSFERLTGAGGNSYATKMQRPLSFSRSKR